MEIYIVFVVLVIAFIYSLFYQAKRHKKEVECIKKDFFRAQEHWTIALKFINQSKQREDSFEKFIASSVVKEKRLKDKYLLDNADEAASPHDFRLQALEGLKKNIRFYKKH